MLDGLEELADKCDMTLTSTHWKTDGYNINLIEFFMIPYEGDNLEKATDEITEYLFSKGINESTIKVFKAKDEDDYHVIQATWE